MDAKQTLKRKIAEQRSLYDARIVRVLDTLHFMQQHMQDTVTPAFLLDCARELQDASNLLGVLRTLEQEYKVTAGQEYAPVSTYTVTYSIQPFVTALDAYVRAVCTYGVVDSARITERHAKMQDLRTTFAACSEQFNPLEYLLYAGSYFADGNHKDAIQLLVNAPVQFVFDKKDGVAHLLFVLSSNCTLMNHTQHDYGTLITTLLDMYVEVHYDKAKFNKQLGTMIEYAVDLVAKVAGIQSLLARMVQAGLIHKYKGEQNV